MMGKLLTVVILLAISASHVCAVENLILNGDFEEGPAGWLKATRAPADMSYDIDEDESISGKKCARFEVLNIGGGGMHDLTLDCDTPIKIEKGETYTVDFWVKAEEDRTIAIDLLMNHDPWTNAFRVENIPITTEWEVQHHTFAAEFDDNNMIFLFSFSRGSNQNPVAVTWIDHVRFYEGKFEEENLLGRPPEAVIPGDKLTVTWAMVRSI